MNKLFIVFAILMIVAVSGCVKEEAEACPAIAMTCPDGTTLTATLPDCKFPECPNITTAPELNESEEKVAIVDYTFFPGEITVKKGTTVTWTNEDIMAHTVSSSLLKTTSKSIKPSGTWNYTFDEVGTYHYYCALHFEKGTVIVE